MTPVDTLDPDCTGNRHVTGDFKFQGHVRKAFGDRDEARDGRSAPTRSPTSGEKGRGWTWVGCRPVTKRSEGMAEPGHCVMGFPRTHLKGPCSRRKRQLDLPSSSQKVHPQAQTQDTFQRPGPALQFSSLSDTSTLRNDAQLFHRIQLDSSENPKHYHHHHV